MVQEQYRYLKISQLSARQSGQLRHPLETDRFAESTNQTTGPATIRDFLERGGPKYTKNIRAFYCVRPQEFLIAERIVTDYKTFAGKPTIRDTRVAVEHLLGMMADGATYEDILRNYSFLEEDDIRACVMYAWQIVSHEHIEPLQKSAG